MADGSRQLIERLAARGDRPLTFMEVCGTHTMAAARAGLRGALPASIRLISGPGCPVCVTPVGYVDHALALAGREDTVVATFGDLMRVPGSFTGASGEAPTTLTSARAAGARVKTVYSPLDALELARSDPGTQVVFLGVGFETTAPTVAASIMSAAAEGIENYTVLPAAKTVPEALRLLAGAKELSLDGFLLPGHVSAVIGTEVYRDLPEKHGLACAVAGFEPEEMLRGIAALVDQVDGGAPRVENCYPGVVRREGNPRARAVLEQVFVGADSDWRGLGVVPGSGLVIRDELGRYDAGRKFDVSLPAPVEPAGCRCGDVLKGLLDPSECGLFGKRCTPDSPVGACMVSSEGSCAARYHYSQGD